MLTPFDKLRRLQTSKDFLELVGDNIDEICDRIVTVDETWVRQYDPESKQESMQWKKKGERPPKKFKAREAVVQKRRGKLSRGVLFLQDNTSVHMARVSRQALKDTGFSEIDHPPYSPDLAPSDYFLFSNLKKELRGRRFVDDKQMKMASRRWAGRAPPAANRAKRALTRPVLPYVRVRANGDRHAFVRGSSLQFSFE
ncbi:Histone-lysine N-methyltransferase SETMAR [Eumeta japonica]|uniref:Histone-lysine N-methyltransferase SETMAR n=1 Tax=Eumeta variegata TaxID=151549 RepID=A0A4C1UDH9_EUMVA|nr:Histone-lysine N-methyltransferase SETMAR [Eumeta japonica]